MICDERSCFSSCFGKNSTNILFGALGFTMLKMPGLASLHDAMKAASIERVRFRIAHNYLVFEGVFLVDLIPYELALACVGHEFVLLFEVSKNYEINTYLGENFSALVRALGNGANSGNRLKTSEFMRELDAKFPHAVTKRDQATRVDVVRAYRHIEEAEKVHFLRFIPHDRAGRRHVTAENLEKTRKLMGQELYEWCRKFNVSTGWSDIPPRVAPSEELPDWFDDR